jgi:hypothetical protein
MKLTNFVAATMTVGALGIGIVGAPAASAAPVVPAPLQPGHGNDDCFPFCNGPGRGPDRGPGHNDRADWNDNHGRWGNDHGDWDNKGPWWANNRHDWWDDRQGPPPWGWGPPPPYQWRGGPLPPTINYYGYNLTPVWNDGPRQWGVWLFGLFIPIFGVG